MVSRNATLNSGESISLEITENVPPVAQLSVDPGANRGRSAANPPINSYDVTIEKQEGGSFTEITGSPVSSSSIDESIFATADTGAGIRATITNTGNGTGTVQAELSGASGGEAAAVMFRNQAVGGGGVTAHAIGGPDHTNSNLANLNSKVTGATLDDQGDTRPPQQHALGGSDHSADTLVNLNSRVSDATLDDQGNTRPPETHATSHENNGGDEINVGGLSGTLADPQDPAAHDLGGADHNSDTLANLNSKVSDADLAENPHDNAQHSTDMVENGPSTPNSPYEIQVNGTDGNGIINFKTS